MPSLRLPRAALVRLFVLLFSLALLVPAHAADAQEQGGGWSVGREDGVAWFRAPDGSRLYSKGVNIVHGFAATDTNRKGVAFSEGVGFHWGSRYPDVATWRRATRDRLISWGFNTRGGWSDPARALALPQTPDLELGRSSQLHWFDLFAPDVPARTLETARTLLAPYDAGSHLLGVFTDNEVGWWNTQLFRWYLSQEPGNGTKRKLLELLQSWYKGSWKSLERDFVASGGAKSFADLEPAKAGLLLRPGGKGMAVVNAFTRLVAGRYYQLVRQAVKDVRPGTLVLGDRLPLYFNQDAVLAMRGEVDAISTNYNVDGADGWVAPWYFESLDKLSGGLPVLVSEWFCAAAENRSGNLNNGHLLTVSTQQIRESAAEAALRNFAALPNIAGTHWFQLYDEPLGGRSDGEDYNFGLLDRFDAPYEGLTGMFARVNPELDAVHAKARFEDSAPTRSIHKAGSQRVGDETTTDWSKRPTRLHGWAVRQPYVPFGDVHLAWTEEGISLLHLAQNHVEPGFLAGGGAFPLGESYRLMLKVDAGAGPRELGIALTPVPSSKWPGVWEIVPQIFRPGHKGSAPALEVSILRKPLPHIEFEAFIPAAALGVKHLRPGQTVRLGLDVRGFHREKRMTFPGPARDPYGPDGPIHTARLILEE